MGKSLIHLYLHLHEARNVSVEIMQEIEYIGYAAGILTTLAFLPQAFKVFRTKQTRDISLLWVALMIVGIFSLALLRLCQPEPAHDNCKRGHTAAFDSHTHFQTSLQVKRTQA